MTTTANTVRLLQHFRAFLASDCARMRDPYDGWMGGTLDKAAARRKLTWLVNVAVNRRAGIPDQLGRTPEYVYRRDQRAAQNKVRRRVSVYQFETRAARERLGHLLSDRGDW